MLNPGRMQGVSLIELMVAVALLSLLTLLAVPALADWTRNARLRSTAEALRADLQMARAEAIRRNGGVRLQFVTALDSSCSLSTSGPTWVSNAELAQSPAGACGNAISASTVPYLTGKSGMPVDSGVVLAASRSTVGFEPLGRQTATTNPATSVASLQVDLSSSSGSCVAAGGAIRCLRVLVSPAGDTRICDPARSATTDPMHC